MVWTRDTKPKTARLSPGGDGPSAFALASVGRRAGRPYLPSGGPAFWSCTVDGKREKVWELNGDQHIMDTLKLHVVPSSDALVQSVAERFNEFLHSPSCTAPHPITIALSGGRIAKSLFTALASQAAGGPPTVLNRCQFFWADERCVPPDHADSNYPVAQQTLLDPLHLAADQVHRIRGELPAAEAAKRAEEELRTVLRRHPSDDCDSDRTIPRLDLVFLGMGEDGHVASLFPGNLELEGSLEDRAFYDVIGPKPPPQRVTMSLRLLANAKQVWVIVPGEAKRATLVNAIAPNSTLPLGRLIQHRPMTDIWTDFTVPARPETPA